MRLDRRGPIVVGYTPSEAADAALAWAADEAELTDAEIIMVHVIPSTMEMGLAAVQIDTEPMRKDVEASLRGPWSAPLRERGIAVRTFSAQGRVAEELMRIARAEGASLIVLGMTGRGTLAELIFGSVHHELVRHAVRPVVAVPPNGRAG